MFIASDLPDILQPRKKTLAQPEAEIRLVLTDSRQITQGAVSIFFAFRGMRTDGHAYVHAAWEHGVRNFVVEEWPERDLPESNVFVVADSVVALQQLAVAHRSAFDIPCIGITGSNGKTWVKEWLFQLMGNDEFIVKSPWSYNSQIGVPLSVLRMGRHHTLAVFEAGISEAGEMDALSRVIRPSIGVLTHFGDAHDAGFESPEQKLAEKCLLFKDADTVIYAGDDPWLMEHMRSLLPGKRLINWGHSADATMQVRTSLRGTGAAVKYHFDGHEYAFELPFQDAASLRNAITCCLIMQHLNVDSDDISERMQRLQPLKMRLDMHQLPNRCILIDDSYSLDITSLQIGLETLEQHSAGMDQIVIISDIDHQRKVVYNDIRRLLNGKALQAVYSIGEVIESMHGLHAEHRHFPNVQTFLDSRVWVGQTNKAYLLTGARRFGMERIVQHMQARLHSAVLEVDFNAMLANLQFFRSRLKRSTRIIAMVKAAAYGGGASEIAKFLEFHNVDALGVAYIDEGIELRQAGVRIPVLVMNPDASALHHLVEHNLQPEVYNIDMLQEILEFVDTYKADMQIHLKMDTGMHRLGFDERKMEQLNGLLDSAPQGLQVVSVFTHLAAATNPAERDFTLVQLNRFEALSRSVTNTLGYQPERHVLNTGGVIHYPQYQYEAVRIGIGLYGIGDHALTPVHTLKARISQIREVPAGETVGYERAYLAERPMRIATMNLGYADGLKRLAGNERFNVTIDGRPAPVVGNVCMDMTMIDVTDLPSARTGDEVIVFGPKGSLEALAEASHTIPYEILTGISARVPRVFRFA